MPRASDLAISAIATVIRSALSEGYNGTLSEALGHAGLKPDTVPKYSEPVERAQKALADLRKRVDGLVEDVVRLYTMTATHADAQRRDVDVRLKAAGEWLKLHADQVAGAGESLSHNAREWVV